MVSKMTWGIALLVLISLLFVFSNFVQKKEVIEPELKDKELESRLNEFAKNIVSGGPPKDGIPPVDRPKYVPVQDADNFLGEKDVVFVVENIDTEKIYPQKILVWHEIVNDVIGGERVSITYCPLTGSTVGFKGKFDSNETTFGTSGKLLNSNLVMYDRATDSYFPQILGMAVKGSQKGKTLEEFPVIWTTWDRAKAKYPGALVLSADTGFLRQYGTDPYGSYQEKGTYYDSGDPFFPVMVTDSRLAAKEVVIGIRINNSALAIVKNKLVESRVANLRMDNRSIVAFYDESLDTVRTYSGHIGTDILNFETRGGKIFDRESNSEWSVLGESTGGEMRGTKLRPINSFDVMWFAWFSFYPQTELYG